jgi:methyl-accepting chemotaxis protein
LALFAIEGLRVGGPLFRQIVDNKDIVADILPPPLYVVEADLVATKLVAHPETVDAAADKLAALRKDYDTRRAYWKTAPIDPAMREMLVDESSAPAMAFWREIDQEILPAVRSGDLERARQGLARADAAYEAHRAVIDKVVVMANHDAAAVEARAAGQTKAGLRPAGRGGRPDAAGGRRRDRPDEPSHRQADPGHDRLHGPAGGRRLRPGRALRRAGRRDRRDGQFGGRVPRGDRRAAGGRGPHRRRTRPDRAAKARHDAERRSEEAGRLQVVEALGAAVARLKAGDLTARLETAFPSAYEGLRGDFNRAIAGLEAALSEVIEGAGGLRAGAGEISGAIEDLSARTERQAASLAETAAALGEVSASVKRTAEGANEANAAVIDSRTVADRSSQVVGRAAEAMSQIESSSAKVSQILGVIDEIAFQTNLLALNAGVEAARAGDAGRGFAVVAQEVRALAQRSAEAAKEIKGLISESSDHVRSGVTLVGEAGAALGDIVERVGVIGGLMEQIAQSSREQAAGLAEVDLAVGQMDQVIQQNAAMAEQATAASRGLADDAVRLEAQVEHFQVSTDQAPGRRPKAARPDPPLFLGQVLAPEQRHRAAGQHDQPGQQQPAPGPPGRPRARLGRGGDEGLQDAPGIGGDQQALPGGRLNRGGQGRLHEHDHQAGDHRAQGRAGQTPIRAARPPISSTSSQVTSITPAYWPRKAGPTDGPTRVAWLDTLPNSPASTEVTAVSSRLQAAASPKTISLAASRLIAAVARGDQPPGLPAIVAGEDRRRADQQEQGGDRARGAGHRAHGPVGQVGRLARHGPAQHGRTNRSPAMLNSMAISGMKPKPQNSETRSRDRRKRSAAMASASIGEVSRSSDWRVQGRPDRRFPGRLRASGLR